MQVNHSENLKEANSPRLKTKSQMKVLKDNKGIKELKLLQEQINKKEKTLIEN